MLAVGVVAGCASGNAIPELDRAQTADDTLPPAAARDVYQPESSRFIGAYEDVAVYFATRVEDEAYCLLLIRNDDAVEGCGPRLPLTVGAFGSRYQLAGDDRDTDAGELLGESVVVLP